MKRFRQSSNRGLVPATVLVVLGLAWPLAFSAPALAGGLQVPTTPGAADAPINFRMSDGKIRLSLEEAIEMALARNLGLAIERFNRQQFQLGIDRALGIYDLGLSADTSFSESSSRTTNPFAGATVLTTENQALTLGLSQLTPIGGIARFSLGGSRDSSNSQFSTLNPSLGVSSSLSYTLPLLRGFGKEATEQQILIARISSDSNRQAFEIQVADTIRQVENAYWDLVEAIDQLRVTEESLALAKELHRRNRVQVDVGTLPPLELVRSEANMATRDEDIIRAKTNVGNANDQLRQLLNVAPGDAWEVEIDPETDPRIAAVEINVADAITKALGERPELAQQKLQMERLALEARLTKQDSKPQLDLTLQYGLSGRGGDLRAIDQEDPDPDPPVVSSTDFGDALEQLTKRDLDGWTVGLTFAYPLQNRAARAQLTIAELEVEKAQAQMANLEQQVRTEVRTAARSVLAAAQQIESAGVSRKLQEKNLEAEQKRYENGMSTSFEVTQVQEDLNAAKSREVTAIASYRRALTEYYRSIGRLLDETGVELVESVN